MQTAKMTASNPLEWMALAEGNEVINDQIEKQINGQTKTAMLQNSIAAEFNRIHKWEKQYNSYLNGLLFIFLSSIDQRTAYIKQKHQTDNGHQCSYHGETTFLL
jgi:hypothetical protein